MSAVGDLRCVDKSLSKYYLVSLSIGHSFVTRTVARSGFPPLAAQFTLSTTSTEIVFLQLLQKPNEGAPHVWTRIYER